MEALQVRPEELARPVAQAVRPVLQRRGAVKVHHHFRAQSCLFQHAAVFFHGGEVKTCLVREVHPLQAGPEGLPDAEDVAVAPKFADQFSLRFQDAGDGFQKSPVVRYPMEGGIGKNDVKPVVPGHEAGVQHAEVHAGIKLPCLSNHFRGGVQPDDGGRFFQQGVRQRAGSAAQVQNGLAGVFRHVGEQVPAIFRDKIMLVFVQISVPVHHCPIIGGKGFFTRKTLSFFKGFSRCCRQGPFLRAVPGFCLRWRG